MPAVFFFFLQKGDKILLPPSAFDTLARLQVDYPMLFRLTSGEHFTHCGVLEFTAEEGCVYIPFWMMQNLLIEEGALLTVKNVSLPKATFVKLQPQSVDFLEISNPRAVLEHALRNFSCVTLGDIIQIPYNNKNFQFELKDVKPSPAACIIETDCNVDFDAPVGYQEPTPVPSQRSSACPSPTTMSQSTASSVAGPEPQEEPKQHGIRIVDGKIIRPDDADQTPTIPEELLAQRTGQTGVQLNAATLPVAAPKVDYWAVNAGDGARLDGKQVTPLKDASGQEIDVRALRAEAAARRAEEMRKQQAATSSTLAAAGGGGKTLSGQPVETTTDAPFHTASAAPVSKRKSRVGNKFSRLKTNTAVAFHGTAKPLED